MKRIVLAAALTVWCTVLFADSINKSGYTDSSIFLPAAGRYLAEMKHETGTRVCIATSTQCAEDADGAYMLYFSQDEREIKPGYREYGVPVRPVMP